MPNLTDAELAALAESVLYRWEQRNRQIGQPLLSNADFHVLYLATRPELHSARPELHSAKRKQDAAELSKRIPSVLPNSNSLVVEMHQLGNGDTSGTTPVSDNECRNFGT